MDTSEAAQRLHDVELLARKAREEGRDLSPWTVLQICEGRVHLPGSVTPLPHDLDMG